MLHVTLKSGREKLLQQGHPWVSVRTMDSEPPALGSAVNVMPSLIAGIETKPIENIEDFRLLCRLIAVLKLFFLAILDTGRNAKIARWMSQSNDRPVLLCFQNPIT